MQSAEAVRNLAAILESYADTSLVVVVSAMGKSTNKLETVVEDWHLGRDWKPGINSLIGYHTGIASELFGEDKPALQSLLEDFELLKAMLGSEAPTDFNEAYDRIVGFGEIFSTRIVSAYLNSLGKHCQWMDARELIVTDMLFREANIEWHETEKRIRHALKPLQRKGNMLALTQGFIGATPDGRPTTLGREGSDFTAAILASALDASEVIIWKDVEGLLNADPKYFGDTCLLDAISYREAIELSYYGATIIHPKTLKPLRNKDIPLYVKSFLDPSGRGSVIRTGEENDHLMPSYIFKVDQVLMTLSPRDFSFMDESLLAGILQAFAAEHIKLNLMQNSAISFSACFDFRADKFSRILERLKQDFRLRYNLGLELITVRHYTEDVIRKITRGKEILIEQRSRLTAQFVAKPKE